MRLNVNMEFKPHNCPEKVLAPSCQKCEHYGGIEWTDCGAEVICHWTRAGTAVSLKRAICTVAPEGGCPKTKTDDCLACKHFAAVVRDSAGKPVILCRHKGK